MSENQLYFAPMEGITGSIYRRAHHRIFGGVDRYYAPFILPIQKEKSAKRIYWKLRRSTMRDVGLFHSFCQTVQRIL